MPYVPERGDVVWLTFDPQAGREQAGRRPALVLSPKIYNDGSDMMICCPITNQVKGYPFEVPIPANAGVTGVILADQIKSQDWRTRRAELLTRLPDNTVQEVINMIKKLLSI